MKELIEEIKECREVLKDFSKIKHLFSDDDNEVKIAKLYKKLSQLMLRAELSQMKEVAHPESEALKEGWSCKIGSLVAVRPCGEEYGDKTYLGFYIGDVALGSSIGITDDKIQLNFSGYNPCMFVPELGENIYGCGSWWSQIKTKEDLKQITDSDINNQWYVKAAKFLSEE